MPHSGVFEVFCQFGFIRFQDTAGARVSEAFYIPPCVLAAGSASCMQSSMERLWPDATLAAVARCSRQFALIILHELMDSLSANKRLSFFRGSSLPLNVWYISHPCSAHLVPLIITGGPTTTAELSVIGDVHAFHFCAGFPAHANALLRSLRCP